MDSNSPSHRGNLHRHQNSPNKHGTTKYRQGYSRPSNSLLACPPKNRKYSSEEQSYPKELVAMCLPLECKLCGVQFTAPIMSKMHYSGKQHLKKVRRFVEWWSHKTGKPIPHIKEPVLSNNLPKPEYCDLCDIQMLTLNEKILHITGKKHLKKLNDPTKRIKRALHCSSMVKQDNEKMENFETSEMFKKETANAQLNKRFKCELCGITTSSEERLITHITNKHKCRVESEKETNNRSPNQLDLSINKCKPCKMNFESNQDLEEHKQTFKHKLNLMNLDKGDRVVPGFEHWYCMMCKAQFTGNKDYVDHLFGEKHRSLEINFTSQRDLFYCTVCDLFIEQEGKDDHMNQQEHRRRMLENYSMSLITNMANKDDKTLYYCCSDCPEAGSMNFIQFNAHLLTQDHIDRVIKRK